MGEEDLAQAQTELRQATSNRMPDRLGEEAHRARILMIAGLVFVVTGALIFIVQMILALHPDFPSAPAIDLVVDAVLVSMGGLAVWLVRSERTRTATWVVIGSVLGIAVFQLYVEGQPATDFSGGLGLFLVVVLGFVLLDRGSAWLVGVICALSFIGIQALWLGGYLPQPISRDPLSQIAFSIVAWLAISVIVAAVISSTMVALRKHREHLEELVEERTRELREAHQRITEVLALNQSIITASSLGITAYDASGVCVLANQSAAQIIGATEEQVLRQNFYHLASWRESNLLQIAEEALTSGSETRKEVHVHSTFGRDIWIDCRFVPFTLGGQPHLLLLTDDVTEQRELQQRLIRQQRLAVLGELAGGVGHELRNPLGAIKNAAYFLNMVLPEQTSDPEVEEALEILEREVIQSERIIGGLLDYARTRSPVRREVDLNGIARAALSRVDVPQCIEVWDQLGHSLPHILGDSDQLRRAFENLIRNAVQAMPEGGRLTVSTEVETPEWVVVSVADTGVGIPEENRSRIFEPLFTTRAKGIGLGLPVVRTLIEGHGGTIAVESAVGEGSAFHVRLPVGGEEGD